MSGEVVFDPATGDRLGQFAILNQQINTTVQTEQTVPIIGESTLLDCRLLNPSLACHFAGIVSPSLAIRMNDPSPAGVVWPDGTEKIPLDRERLAAPSRCSASW